MQSRHPWPIDPLVLKPAETIAGHGPGVWTPVPFSFLFFFSVVLPVFPFTFNEVFVGDFSLEIDTKATRNTLL